MSYATIADFVTAFGDVEAIALTNLDDASVNTIDNDVLQRSLDDASAEIDTYLVARYSLPLASVPRALVRVCGDIARYRLDRNRQREDVRLRYEDCMKFLEQVSRGIVTLGTDLLNQPVAVIGGQAQYQQATRIFSDDTLAAY